MSDKKPTAHAQDRKKKNSYLAKALFEYIKPYKKQFVHAALSMIMLAALRGGVVYLMGPVIQGVFMEKNLRMLRLVLIGLPILFALRMTTEYINGYLMSWIGQKAVQQIRDDLFTHIHRLSIEFYWRKRSSDVMSRVINDLNNVQSTVQFVPLYLIRDTFTVSALIFVLFYVNWRFALISLIIIPITSSTMKILGRKMRKSSMESQVIVSEISHRFQESLQGMTVVKAFNYEEEAIAKFRSSNNEYFGKTMRYLRAAAMTGPLMEFIGSIILVVMIYLGGHAIFEGTMTTAAFFSFIAAFFTAYMPLKNIANLNSNLQLGLASWERILQILDEKPTVTIVNNPKPLGTVQGRVEFDSLGYKYPSRDTQVLKNLSFTIEPGQVAAFVGPSGSGKTTIIHLLLRFFDPVSGRVLIDGRELREIDTKELKDHMGLVTQDTILFDDTVFKNITIGKPGASMDEVIEAATAADVHGFIKDMPQGYDTRLGERGVKLSGGQRQRLAIARAIIKKPEILLLDEATSNLDTASEQVVQAAIERILKGRTVVMVAHRLSTVRNADKIFVLKHGELAESGSHEELLAKNGVYKTLYEAQN
ncbi:MAG: ABC transporter ATP-binding protein [Elusimicrobia bacterium]|nr:ABC transporter ATP-binding protein [Elusimicrobiota bacterium]